MNMILTLESKQFLRLSRARGATVEVLDGSVWITEAGRARDAVVSRGMRYAVAGDGLVVVGADDDNARGATRISLRPPVWRRVWQVALQFLRALIADVRERQTIAQLEELSDRTLRDIGLRRDQIETAVRHRAWY